MIETSTALQLVKEKFKKCLRKIQTSQVVGI
jgi:hypothetical protein